MPATDQHPIRPTDRVAQVLARDASLVEVFVRHSPRFAKLRHAALRRVMARLVTLEHAAELAEIPVAPLVADLNRALGLADAGDPAGDPSAVPDPEPAPRTPPPHAPEVTLDVREDLRRGEEPFTRITAAVNALAAGEVLRLHVPFRPVPLIRLLARRGFAHHATRLGDDDWIIRLFRAGGRAGSTARALAEPAPAPAAPIAVASDEIMLDVTGLAPPEPLVRTLAALEQLPPDATLVQVNVRTPQHLLPMLRERGFAYEITHDAAGPVLTRIRRAAG